MLEVIATVPAELDLIVTDATTLWGTVKTFILAVAVFYIMFRIVKRVRGK